MPKLLGITQSNFDPASRFRFIQLIPHLQRAGWQIDHRPNCPDRQWKSPLRSSLARAVHYRAGRTLMKANRLRDVLDASEFDAVFVNRDFASEGRLFQKLFWPLVQKSVFDFDDAIFIGPHEKQVRWLCAHSFWVTPGNDYLASYARRFTDRVTVIPTVIDTDKYVPRSYANSQPDCVRVGWSGSDQSIHATLFPHLPMLARLQARIDFELVVITNTKPTLPVSGLRWTFHPWCQEEEPFLESKMDIGIMPLVDDEFQKGKCALKLLQYMAAGLPTVGSPVGVNKEVVLQGVTGMLASTEDDWHRSLETLIRSKMARCSMGCSGREHCGKNYSIHRWLPVLTNIFDSVREKNALKNWEDSGHSTAKQETTDSP